MDPEDSSLLQMRQAGNRNGNGATSSVAVNTSANQTFDAVSSTAMWRSAVIVTIHSFLFGYALASLGPCLVDTAKGSILHDIDLSKFLQQLATGVLILGALIGALVSAAPVQRFGPRAVLAFTNIFWIAGALLCIIVSVPALMVGRFIVGLGLGISSATVPVLLSEIATNKNRGVVTSLCQLMITIGIFVAGIMAYGLVEYVKQGWRPLLAAPAGFGAIGLLCTPLVVDSPVWLAANNPEADAKRAFAVLRGHPLSLLNNNVSSSGSTSSSLSPVSGNGLSGYPAAVEAEYAMLSRNAREEAALPPLSWTEVFTHKRAMAIGFGMMFFQPMVGINAVIFYSSKIFEYAGMEQAILGTVLVGVINVLVTVISMGLVERAGRRILLLVGTAICVVAIAVIAFVLLLMPDQGDGPKDVKTGAVAVAGVLLYLVGYAVGIGSVTWVVIGEVLSPRVRSKAYSVFVAEAWACNLIIAMTTLSAIEGLGGGSSDDQQRKGVAWLFAIFGFICIAAVVFIAKFVPETKGLSTSAITAMLNGRGSGPSDDGESASSSLHHNAASSSTADSAIYDNDQTA